MLEHLALSGLNSRDAKKLRLKWLTPSAAQKMLQSDFPLPCGGIYFPYFSFDGKIDDVTCRVRLLADPSNGYVEDKVPKYMQPSGTPPRIYLPPFVKWGDIINDATQRLVITEGEKKAAAACKAGVACIGLGGVWSFQQKDTGVSLLPDLTAFNWIGRQVIIAYDSDWSSNKDVRKASGVLARRLSERGAEVKAALIGHNPGGGKMGIDDLIVARGEKAFKAVLDASLSLTPELEATAEYRSRFVLIKTLACAYECETGNLYPRRRFEDGHPDEKIQMISETGRNIMVTKAQYWWSDPNKRSARELVLEPDQPEITADGNLNRFRGWGTKPQRGSTEIWQTLLKIVFQNQPHLIRWFEKWCAYPLQNPGAKLHTAVFVYGGQGVGKTAIGQILMDIYGKSGRLLQDRQIFGGFNGWVGETLFALADDLAFDERRKSRSVLKMLVAGETIEVNEKYVPSYAIANRCNFYFTANSPNALPLDPSGLNRRFLVVEAPLVRPRPESWYTGTLDKWRKNGGSAHVHDRLMHIDLDGFYTYADAPESKAKRLVMETGRSGAESWCAELPDNTQIALATARQLWKKYQAETGDHLTGLGTFTASLRSVAEPLGQHRIGDETLSLWALRDIKKWKRAAPKTRAAQYNKDRGLL